MLRRVFAGLLLALALVGGAWAQGCPGGLPPGACAPMQQRIALSGALPSGWTFSRASTATYIANGVIYTAASGVPRFESAGLLIEPLVQELNPWPTPQADTTNGWNYGTVNTVGTVNNAVAPDGATTAAKIADNSNNAVHYASVGNFAFTSGTTYSLIAYVEPSTATVAQLAFPGTQFGLNAWASFNLATGQVAQTGSAATAFPPVLMANGYYKLAITAPATATSSGAVYAVLTNNSTAATRLPSYAGSGEYFYLWGVGVRAETVPSSFIYAAGSAVTRQADNLSAPLSLYPWWQSPMGWTLSLDWSAISGNQTGSIIGGVSDGTSNNTALTILVSSTQYQVRTYVAGNGVFSGNLNIASANVTAVSRSATGFAYSANGSGGTIANANLPRMTTLVLGHNPGAAGQGYFAGHLSALTLRAGPTPAAQLQAMQ